MQIWKIKLLIISQIKLNWAKIKLSKKKMVFSTQTIWKAWLSLTQWSSHCTVSGSDIFDFCISWTHKMNNNMWCKKTRKYRSFKALKFSNFRHDFTASMVLSNLSDINQSVIIKGVQLMDWFLIGNSRRQKDPDGSFWQTVVLSHL